MADGGERGVRIPALMLGAAVLLWGWHQSAMVYAVIAAIAIEGARIAPFRWDFSDEDFHRLGDVSGIGLVLLAVVQFSDRGMNGIYGVLQWFPLVVLALTLAQLYSTRPTVRLSAMFLSVRYALRRGQITYPGELDMRLPFFIACLLSATAGAGRSPWVIPVEVALIVWLLLHNRARRARLAPVAVALVLCMVVVALSAGTVSSVRHALGPIIMDIVRERMAHWRDPFRNHTALGEIGRLKVSDRIVLRIESPPGTPVPELLHEASYTHLSNNVWIAGSSRFEELEPLSDGTRWDLAEPQRPFRTVTVSKGLIRNKGMLAVPAGAFRMDELPVEELTVNSMGALKVNNGPALVRYRVRYGDGIGRVSAPGEDDLSVPRRLKPVLSRTLEKLGVEPGMAPGKVAGALLRYFNNEFTYSLELTSPRPIAHPVEDFLEGDRSGHCEFFATSTVMLLRAAGIPARYSTGYSVQEYSSLEKAWVVRRRHSHSWASAWIGGRWVDLDTTPVQWFASESDGAAWWQPVYDMMSWLFHQFSRWRLERVEGGTQEDSLLAWLLLPLSLFLAWRIYRSRRVGRRPSKTARRGGVPADQAPGADSEFRRIEALLRDFGVARPGQCPPRTWISRLAETGALPPGGEHWRDIVDLHYRLRFSPGGLDSAGREQLARGVAQWIARAGSPPVASS